jgi:hypothetical protein
MCRLIMSLVITVFAVGCSTIQEQTKFIISTTVFHGTDHAKRGTIAVKPLDKIQEGSLEFKAVSEYLTNSMKVLGYTPSNYEPQYIAHISYGIDNGQTTVSSMPIYGQTGGGTSFTTGTINSGSRIGTYSGTTTSMPSFGQIGSIPLEQTTFKRVLLVDIYRLENEAQPVKVYEIKTNSTGSCGNINYVLPAMISGMVMSLPGLNGKTKTVEIPSDGTC